MILCIVGVLLHILLLEDKLVYGQFPFPTPLDCNFIIHEPCLLYGAGYVCGSDGKNYFNRCKLAQAWCSNPLITVIGGGSCSDLGYTPPYITTRPTTQDSAAPTTPRTTPQTSPITTTQTTQKTFKSVSLTTVMAPVSDPLGVICSTLPRVSCPSDIEPVCGTDDRTYINSCEFNKEVCQHHNLRVKHIGFC